MKMIFSHSLGTKETEADINLLLNDSNLGGSLARFRKPEKSHLFCMDTKGHILENQTICLRQRDKGVLQKGVCLSWTQG